MKIALVNKVFSRRHGGGEKYALDLAESLCRLGHHVDLLGHVIDDPPAGAVPLEIPLPQWSKSRKTLGFIRSVRRELTHRHYDIVYGMTPCYPVDVLFLGGGVWTHHMRVRYPSWLGRWYRYVVHPVQLTNALVERRLYGRHMPRRVIANSELGKGHLTRFYNVPGERIVVARHGVDHHVFNPGMRALHRGPQRQALGLGDDELAVLFVGNNWRLKGVETIIRAAKVLCERGQAVRILIVGKGKPWQYESIAQKLGIKPCLMFLGHSSQVQRYYAAADVFALPTRYDPFAVVTLEAMACGLPAITSIHNGAAEVIQHGVTGMVMQEPDDWRTLADHLMALGDAGLRAKLGAAAAQTAQPFTHEANARAVAEVFQDVMRERECGI